MRSPLVSLNRTLMPNPPRRNEDKKVKRNGPKPETPTPLPQPAGAPNQAKADATMLPGAGRDDDGKRRGATAAASESAASSSAASSLNDLCATAAAGGPAAPAPFPRAAAWALAALLAVGLGVGALVLAVVHSAALLAVSIALSAAVAAFLLWNAAAAASGRALRRFVDGLPASSLRVADDGQLVKINGVCLPFPSALRFLPYQFSAIDLKIVLGTVTCGSPQLSRYSPLR